MEIKPIEKNKRNCERCLAAYVINGDPSSYWRESPWNNAKKEGKCEFCKDSFLNQCHSLVINQCKCGKPSAFSGLICGQATRKEHMRKYNEKRGVIISEEDLEKYYGDN